MYHAQQDGKTLSTERLLWVRLQPNGVYILCDETEGQGVILDGEIYHVDGREKIDKPTIYLYWQDDVTAVSEATEGMEALVVDQEYRLILLELGV